MSWRVPIVIMIAPLAIGLAHAEPLAPDRAVALALAHSAELEARRHQISEAETEVDAALRLPNPTLRLGTFRSDRTLMPLVDDGSYRDPLDDVSIGLRWNPPNPGARDARAARAARRVDQLRARLELERRKLVARVRVEHATVVELDGRVAHAQIAVELRDALRALVARRLEAAAATALDRNLAELDHLDALADLEALGSKRREAGDALRRTIGWAPDMPLEPEAPEDPACRVPTESVDALVTRALAGHPGLAVHDAREAEIAAEVEHLELERLPWLDFVEISYEFAEGSDPARLTNPACTRGRCDDPSHFGVRLGVTLPVIDRKHPELAGLSARRARVSAQREATRRQIEGDVRRAVDELIRAAEIEARFDAAHAALVADSLDRIRRSIAAGVADPIQLAAAQRRVLRAGRARLEAVLRCARSAAALARQLGDAS